MVVKFNPSLREKIKETSGILSDLSVRLGYWLSNKVMTDISG